jgi:hypothetical protein
MGVTTKKEACNNSKTRFPGFPFLPWFSLQNLPPLKKRPRKPIKTHQNPDLLGMAAGRVGICVGGPDGGMAGDGWVMVCTVGATVGATGGATVGAGGATWAGGMAGGAGGRMGIGYAGAAGCLGRGNMGKRKHQPQPHSTTRMMNIDELD